MEKIFSFGVDEDGIVFNREFEDWEGYYEGEGKDLIEYVFGEDGSVEKKINNKDVKGCFDYEGGEEEFGIFKSLSEKYNGFLKENKDYVLICYNVEYDNSYLIMKECDYKEVLEILKGGEE